MIALHQLHAEDKAIALKFQPPHLIAIPAAPVPPKLLIV